MTVHRVSTGDRRLFNMYVFRGTLSSTTAGIVVNEASNSASPTLHVHMVIRIYVIESIVIK